ncbi:MAG: hypothetical protein LBJ00_12655 [Planctomycetaceae bacterium]|nr:hypothetical protein [Planctomycetaceae bacterium]
MIAQDKLAVKSSEIKMQHVGGIGAKFIVALISDGEGGAWIGSEDNGVFHYDANGKISQFTTKNGLGDNNSYALAIDKLGRLWVGHLNTGVSVFNGKNWRNYDVGEGPIGERIFDIKICPIDGDVWLTTSAGLTRYKISTNTWEHITREDGLLEDQASAIAFKEDGTLIVGTQCYGLAIFNRVENGDYKHSRNILAPERFGTDNYSPVPLLSRGQGLPSNQINDIIVTKNTTSKSIWIATSAGLVKATNDLSKIEYIRGKDFVNKIHGLYGGTPQNFKQPTAAILNQLMPNDRLTTVVEDLVGQIWVGNWQSGIWVLDAITAKHTLTQKGSGLPDNFVTKILPLKDSHFLVGTYGGGIAKSTQPFNMPGRKPANYITPTKENSVLKKDFLNLPNPAQPPTIDELKSSHAKLNNFKTPLPKIYVANYGEDWKTQGNWVGNYGRQYAIMCGASSPFDQLFFMNESDINVRPFIGPNKRKGDTLRRWVHWFKSEDRRVMYSPINGYRRQSEWDDHAETYPLTHNGPDLWYLIDIEKQGVYKLSMYFFNKDGHGGRDRLRDFLVEIYPASATWTNFSDMERLDKIAETQTKSPPLARTRVVNFWGGVHKSLELNGNNKYFVRIANNFTFCTIMSSVCVDRVDGQESYNDTVGLSLTQNVPYCPPQFPSVIPNPTCREAVKLWKSLEKQNTNIGTSAHRRKIQLQILQLTKNSNINTNDNLLPAISQHLNQWDKHQTNNWHNFITESKKRTTNNTKPDQIKSQTTSLNKPKQKPWTGWRR